VRGSARSPRRGPGAPTPGSAPACRPSLRGGPPPRLASVPRARGTPPNTACSRGSPATAHATARAACPRQPNVVSRRGASPARPCWLARGIARPWPRCGCPRVVRVPCSPACLARPSAVRIARLLAVGPRHGLLAVRGPSARDLPRAPWRGLPHAQRLVALFA
jgi:hypothetical protein